MVNKKRGGKVPVKVNNHGYPEWYKLICGPVELLLHHPDADEGVKCICIFMCFPACFMWASAQISNRHSVSSLLHVEAQLIFTRRSDNVLLVWVTTHPTIIPSACYAQRGIWFLELDRAVVRSHLKRTAPGFVWKWIETTSSGRWFGTHQSEVVAFTPTKMYRTPRDQTRLH